MISLLRKLFDGPEPEDAAGARHRRELATAALLLEVARADFEDSPEEVEAVSSILERELNLTPTEVTAALEAAGETVDTATSLYEFTRVINDHCDGDERIDLIAAMWRVACADGRIDKYEEHLIRRVADLTYVAHADYIRCKHEACGDGLRPA